MKIELLQDSRVTITAGTKLELEAAQARLLISSGRAKEVTAKKTPKKEEK